MEKTKAIETYLNEIGPTPLLSDAEEQELARRIAGGDEDAVRELAAANLRYVVSLANQYSRRGLGLEDLVSEGNIGLLKAAAKFGKKAGKRFVAFAAPYIRQSMENAIESQVGLYKVPAKEATPGDQRQKMPLSVDEPLPVGSNTNFNLLSIIENGDAEQADELVHRNGLSEAMALAIDVLDERERAVITRYFALDTPARTMAEIASELGLKRERVRQIRDKALRKLRKAEGRRMAEFQEQ